MEEGNIGAANPRAQKKKKGGCGEGRQAGCASALKRTPSHTPAPPGRALILIGY